MIFVFLVCDGTVPTQNELVKYYDEHCYVFKYAEHLNYTDSIAACESFGMHLITADDNGEFQWLQQNAISMYAHFTIPSQ